MPPKQNPFHEKTISRNDTKKSPNALHLEILQKLENSQERQFFNECVWSSKFTLCIYIFTPIVGKKSLQNSGLNWDLNPDICDAGGVHYQFSD